MDARYFLNRLKQEVGIKTDKDLAAAMGVRYGTLTKWVARNSIPKDPLVAFVVKQGIDLKQLAYDEISEMTRRQFSGSAVPRLSKSAIDSLLDQEAQVFSDQMRDAYLFIAQYGNMALLKKFEKELSSISASYIEKCEKLREILSD